MIRAVKLLFTPAQEWEKISLSDIGYSYVIFLFLLPLTLISAGVEGCSLIKFGLNAYEFGGRTLVPQEIALKYEAVSFGLIWAAILLGAQFVRSVCKSFHVQVTFFQCFAMTAFSLYPIMLAHIIDSIPALNTWICFAIGVFLMCGLLYNGVGFMLKPEPTKGFGLFIFSALIMTVLTALSHFAASTILNPRYWATAKSVSLLL